MRRAGKNSDGPSKAKSRGAKKSWDKLGKDQAETSKEKKPRAIEVKAKKRNRDATRTIFLSSYIIFEPSAPGMPMTCMSKLVTC